MRIFPEMCARTLWPFSNSTRNIALGSGSTTVPSTRIVSSLGFARTFHRLRRARRARPVITNVVHEQNLRADSQNGLADQLAHGLAGGIAEWPYQRRADR